MSKFTIFAAAAVAMLYAGPVFSAAPPLLSGKSLPHTCKQVRLSMPGSAWRIVQSKFSYPRASVAQFSLFSSNVTSSACRGNNKNVVGTFHLTNQGPVQGKVTFTACAPDGRKVNGTVFVNLPNPPSTIRVAEGDYRITGRCR